MIIRPVLALLLASSAAAAKTNLPSKPVDVKEALEAVYAETYRPEVDGGVVELAGKLRGVVTLPEGEQPLKGKFSWKRGKAPKFEVEVGGEPVAAPEMGPWTYLIPRWDYYGTSLVNPEATPDRYQCVVYGDKSAKPGEAASLYYKFVLKEATEEEAADLNMLMGIVFAMAPEGYISVGIRTMGQGFQNSDGTATWVKKGDRYQPVTLQGEFHSEVDPSVKGSYVCTFEYGDVEGAWLPVRVKYESVEMEFSYDVVKRQTPAAGR